MNAGRYLVHEAPWGGLELEGGEVELPVLLGPGLALEHVQRHSPCSRTIRELRHPCGQMHQASAVLAQRVPVQRCRTLRADEERRVELGSRLQQDLLSLHRVPLVLGLDRHAQLLISKRQYGPLRYSDKRRVNDDPSCQR